MCPLPHSVFPAFLHRFPNPLCIFLAVIFVEVRCFDIGWRARVGIVKETIGCIRAQFLLLSVHSYLWMLVSTAATSYVGLHLFCRMSRHSSPVAYTLGWNIWLINFTCGGLLGYCSSNCITRRNVPSSKGVSAGPIMTAFLRIAMCVRKGYLRRRPCIGQDTNHVMTLSGIGEAETPAGGSVCMRCNMVSKGQTGARLGVTHLEVPH